MRKKNADGPYKEFFKHGKIKAEGFYANNLKEGVWKEYWLNGNLKNETTYKKGLKEGFYTEYWTEGDLKVRCFFINDLRQGALEGYYGNNKIWYIQSYKDNKLEGKVLVFYRNYNQVEFISERVNNRYINLSQHFNPDGSKRFETLYII